MAGRQYFISQGFGVRLGGHSWNCDPFSETQKLKCDLTICNKESGFIVIFSFKLFFYFFKIWLCCVACGILVPWPGIEPAPSAVKVRSPNHWTSREVPPVSSFTFHRNNSNSIKLRGKEKKETKSSNKEIIQSSYRKIEVIKDSNSNNINSCNNKILPHPIWYLPRKWNKTTTTTKIRVYSLG